MELQNEGMPVSTNLVVMKAWSLMPNEFNDKNETTQYQAVSHMLKRHTLLFVQRQMRHSKLLQR